MKVDERERPRRRSEREGRFYSLDELWKLERQLDAIQQHTRIALVIVRQAIKDRDGYRQRRRRPPGQASLEEALDEDDVEPTADGDVYPRGYPKSE